MDVSIKILAENYNQFQHDFGQSLSKDYAKEIEGLFTPNVIKVANGNELVDGRASLLPQLNGVKEFAGNWTIHNQEVIPSADNTKCTIRYDLKSEKAGHFEVIAILSAKDGQIARIEEVFYQKG
jgi:hypothetical protein